MNDFILQVAQQVGRLHLFNKVAKKIFPVRTARADGELCPVGWYQPAQPLFGCPCGCQSHGTCAIGGQAACLWKDADECCQENPPYGCACFYSLPVCIWCNDPRCTASPCY